MTGPASSTPGNDALVDPVALVKGWIEELRESTSSVADLLCDRHPTDSVALHLIEPDLSARQIVFGELADRSRRFAAVLAAHGVGPGDHVAVMLPKGEELVVALLGAWRLGAVIVPLFTAFASPAVAYRLNDCQAAVVVTDRTNRPKFDAVDVDVVIVIEATGTDLDFWSAIGSAAPLVGGSQSHAGSHPFILLYTSGTTGQPKGVPVPVEALASMQAYLTLGLDLRPDDVYWNVADPGWAYGLYYAIVAPLLTATPTILLRSGFDPVLLVDVLRSFGVTNLAAAPTVYRSVRAAVPPEDLAGLSLRVASSAGEPLNAGLVDWSRDVLGVSIHDHYGQTELGMVVNNHHHPLVQRDLLPGSMGVALPGYDVVVLDDDDRPAAPGALGRLAVDITHSPLYWFGGYFGSAGQATERFSADGRYHLTGDAAVGESDGRFTFSARADDVIIMAGYRIGPVEIETVLLSHMDVVDAAVVGVADSLRGEVIEAFVVLAGGAKASDDLTVELQQLVKSKLAAHLYPRRVHVVNELPRTPSGKVQRFVLRERAEGAVGGRAP